MSATARPVLHANRLPTVAELTRTLRWQCAYRQQQGVTPEAIIGGLIDCLVNSADKEDLVEVLRLYAAKWQIPPEALP